MDTFTSLVIMTGKFTGGGLYGRPWVHGSRKRYSASSLGGQMILIPVNHCIGGGEAGVVLKFVS